MSCVWCKLVFGWELSEDVLMGSNQTPLLLLPQSIFRAFRKKQNLFILTLINL